MGTGKLWGLLDTVREMDDAGWMQRDSEIRTQAGTTQAGSKRSRGTTGVAWVPWGTANMAYGI